MAPELVLTEVCALLGVTSTDRSTADAVLQELIIVPAFLLAATERLAECCTRAWKLMAANRFAGEADVQQRIPVLFFRAELHGHPPSQALWSREARSMRA